MTHFYVYLQLVCRFLAIARALSSGAMSETTYAGATDTPGSVVDGSGRPRI